MALIVENGTGKPDADSYISHADAVTYATLYGYTLPLDQDKAEVMLRRGAGYVDSQTFTGSRATTTQALEWPRNGMSCNGVTVPNDTIPLNVQYAQVIAAHYINSGEYSEGVTGGRSIASEKLGPDLSISYTSSSSSDGEIPVQINPALEKLKCYTVDIEGKQFKVHYL